MSTVAENDTSWSAVMTGVGNGVSIDISRLPLATAWARSELIPQIWMERTLPKPPSRARINNPGGLKRRSTYYPRTGGSGRGRDMWWRRWPTTPVPGYTCPTPGWQRCRHLIANDWEISEPTLIRLELVSSKKWDVSALQWPLMLGLKSLHFHYVN